MDKFIFRAVSLLLIAASLNQGTLLAQEVPLSLKVAKIAVAVGKNSGSLAYEQAKGSGILPGIFLQGLDAVWNRTARGIYFANMRSIMDSFVDKDGNFKGYESTDFSIGGNKNYSPLLTIYKVTGQQKYFKAASAVWNQLQHHQADQSREGYSSAAFAAEYGALVHDKQVFDRITNQFAAVNIPLQSPEYGLALVDALTFFPDGHAGRKKLLQILRRFVEHLEKRQAPSTGLWPDADVSAASMYVYTIGKAVRLGYVPAGKILVAKQGYAGIRRSFIDGGKDGKVMVKGNQGKVNDPEEIGAFLLAANEVELAALPKPGKGKVVVLDSWFNNEIKRDQIDSLVRWHYKWDERADGGFSFWGGQFNAAGYETKTQYSKPDASNLKDVAVYIIVDPDSEKENSNPNYIQAADVEEISSWVKSGGVLVLMGNDTANVEHVHLNALAAALGIPFHQNSKGKVLNDNFEMGKIDVKRGDMLFKTAKCIFIKEFSSIDVTGGATPVLKDRDGNVVIATRKFGKGVVMAVGDPWLYNEYVDGRRLPEEYDNFKAGADLINWIGTKDKKTKN